MRIAIALIACAAPFAAAAAESSAGTYRERTLEGYCAKLRESPVALVQHAHRLRAIHGYAVSDFVPAYPGAPVKADCRLSPAKLAAAQAAIALPKESPQ